MTTKGKALVLISSAAMLVTGTVFGTLAYFTAKETVINTFTVGKVEIDLNESDYDGDGNTQANEYRLVPGMEYKKDPTVTVKADSESAYVRMIVTVHNYSTVKALIADTSNGITDFTDFLGNMDDSVWVPAGSVEDTEKGTISYEYRYYTTAAGSASDVTLEPLFDTLIVPAALDGDELQALYDGGFRIDVEGHAIQAEGFETEDAAWTAFDGQVTE
ncbi:MAG: hypothetical protein IJ512_03380 [Ruminococcus sp.]|nr:hypothetical protein [Ruminococcus sp.]